MANEVPVELIVLANRVLQLNSGQLIYLKPIFMCSIQYIQVNLSFMRKSTNAHFMMMFSCICLLFLASTYFGHSCDHVQSVRR